MAFSKISISSGCKIRRYLPPKPVVTNIFNSSTDFYSRTIALLVIFSQYLRRFDVPLPAFSRDRGCHVIHYPLFRSFPVSIAREKTELIPINIFRCFAIHRRQLCAYLGDKFMLSVFTTASILLNKQLRHHEACTWRRHWRSWSLESIRSAQIFDSFRG